MCGCCSRRFQQGAVECLNRGPVKISIENFSLTALVTLLRSSVCGLRNISELCKLFRARPAPASTHLDPGLPSPGFTTSPARSHPPPNVAKVESDQNVKMAKCVPPYTLHTTVLHICRLQYNGHDMLCSGNTIIYSTIVASAVD